MSLLLPRFNVYIPPVENRGRFHQHIYSKLLREEIPEALKGSQVISVFCALGIWTQKAARKNVGEIDFRDLKFNLKLVRSYSKRDFKMCTLM